MANLSEKIKKHLGRKIDFLTDVILFNDDGESYIKEWNVDEAEPSLEDLDKIDVTTEVALAEALSNRKAEYPAIPDQLDEIYHNGIDSWKAVIKVTKDKYPKG